MAEDEKVRAVRVTLLIIVVAIVITDLYLVSSLNAVSVRLCY